MSRIEGVVRLVEFGVDINLGAIVFVEGGFVLGIERLADIRHHDISRGSGSARTYGTTDLLDEAVFSGRDVEGLVRSNIRIDVGADRRINSINGDADADARTQSS